MIAGHSSVWAFNGEIGRWWWRWSSSLGQIRPMFIKTYLRFFWCMMFGFRSNVPKTRELGKTEETAWNEQKTGCKRWNLISVFRLRLPSLQPRPPAVRMVPDRDRKTLCRLLVFALIPTVIALFRSEWFPFSVISKHLTFIHETRVKAVNIYLKSLACV